MDKTIFALTIVGVEKIEYTICNLFLDAVKNAQYGEIPGKNLRQLLDITKEKLFGMLENLVSKGIFKYSKTPVDTNILYVKAGEGQYIFNPNYYRWIPSESSLFYKICKLNSYRFNADSWMVVLDSYDIRRETTKLTSTDDKLTPYQLYDIFCGKYRKIFSNEYKPTHIERDLAYCKKVICDCSFKNLKDNQILEFLDWAFRVKVKEFRGEFLVGFLPLCLRDYLASTIVSVVKPGYAKDENGQVKKL